MNKIEFKILKRIELMIFLFTLFVPLWAIFAIAANQGFGFPILPLLSPLGYPLGLLFLISLSDLNVLLVLRIIFFIFLILPVLMILLPKCRMNYICFWVVFVTNCIFDIVMVVGSLSDIGLYTYSFLMNLVCYLILGLYIILKIRNKGVGE